MSGAKKKAKSRMLSWSWDGWNHEGRAKILSWVSMFFVGVGGILVDSVVLAHDSSLPRLGPFSLVFLMIAANLLTLLVLALID